MLNACVKPVSQEKWGSWQQKASLVVWVVAQSIDRLQIMKLRRSDSSQSFVLGNHVDV